MFKKLVFRPSREKELSDNCLSVLDAVSKNTLQAMVVIDRNYRILYLNDICSRLGYSTIKQRIKVKDILIEYITEEDKGLFKRTIAKVFAGKTVTIEREFKKNTGESVWFSIRCTPMNKNNKIIDAIFISLLDLTNVRMLENSLRENNNTLSETERLGKLAAFKIEYPYGKAVWSKEAANILGVDLVNSPLNIYEFLCYVHPNDKNKLISTIEDSIISKEKFQLVFRFIRDEIIMFLQITGSVKYDERTGKNFFTGSFMDVTDTKKSEEKVRSIIMENEALMKEIQHRVKNNFQMMLSLISLQSHHIKNAEFLEVFKTTQNRVKSLAMIYEKLYYSKEISKIDFGEYVNHLIRNLIYTFNANAAQISLNINIEDIPLDLNVAVPCGLIVNEIISNSIKHAFKGSEQLELSISMQGKEDQVELILSDNGPGLPEKLNFRSPETLGLQLVMIEVNQIDGAINYEKRNGSCFIVTFPYQRNDLKENGELN